MRVRADLCAAPRRFKCLFNGLTKQMLASSFERTKDLYRLISTWDGKPLIFIPSIDIFIPASVVNLFASTAEYSDLFGDQVILRRIVIVAANAGIPLKLTDEIFPCVIAESKRLSFSKSSWSSGVDSLNRTPSKALLNDS